MVTSQVRLEELVKTMRTVFCQELGLVSVNAQMKVAPPDGLVLNENLVELAGMMSEDDSTPSTSIFFYPCSRHSVDTRDEPAVSICPSSLSEHRKRHGLFYLQTGKLRTSQMITLKLMILYHLLAIILLMMTS